MTVGGTQRTPLTWIVKNGAASCAGVTLSNAATGESVVWGNTLAVSAWLRLRSDIQRAEVSTDSGANWTKRNENMTGVIPQLQGGTSNVITQVGPTTGTHEYSYTAKG